MNPYIKPDLIVCDLKAQSKEESIRKLVDRIFDAPDSTIDTALSRESVTQRVLDREKIQTTGLGNGVAFPHARLDDLSDLVVAIGTNRAGIDWGSFDGLSCHIICLMISPAQKPYIILQAMAALSRFFADENNVARVAEAADPRAVAYMLITSAVETERVVLARDIMKPVEKTVTLETPIEQAAHIMHLNQLDILPVVDGDRVLEGEISCLDIFTYGIPDLFNQLQTISFMRYLDPFEKYFRFHKTLAVKDVYNPSANTIALNATLMEIIFEMTTHNKSKLFVVDDRRLVGVVDRFAIIDKILFF